MSGNGDVSLKPSKRDARMFRALASAQESGAISLATLARLESDLRILAKLSPGRGGVTTAITRYPEELLSTIMRKWTVPETRAAKISACCSALKYDLALGTAKNREFWSEASRRVTQTVRDKLDDNVMTDREEESMPDLHDLRERVVAMRDTRPHAELKSSQEFLFLLISASVPPKRAELGNIVIYRGPSRNSEQCETCNSLQLPSSGPATLVLRTYKTEKLYGVYEEKIPKFVTDEIRASLRAHPRDLLFQDARGLPFSNNSWSHWVKRTFFKHTGHYRTINGLRKAWVHAYAADGSKFTLSQQKLLAQAMLHSTGTQRAHYVRVRRA